MLSQSARKILLLCKESRYVSAITSALIGGQCKAPVLRKGSLKGRDYGPRRRQFKRGLISMSVSILSTEL